MYMVAGAPSVHSSASQVGSPAKHTCARPHDTSIRRDGAQRFVHDEALADSVHATQQGFAHITGSTASCQQKFLLCPEGWCAQSGWKANIQPFFPECVTGERQVAPQRLSACPRANGQQLVMAIPARPERPADGAQQPRRLLAGAPRRPPQSAPIAAQRRAAAPPRPPAHRSVFVTLPSPQSAHFKVKH